jgi:hypothetical protein
MDDYKKFPWSGPFLAEGGARLSCAKPDGGTSTYPAFAWATKKGRTVSCTASQRIRSLLIALERLSA